MICGRCEGRMLLDRVFTDNVSFEASCLHCGFRKFIDKGSDIGKWLKKLEDRLVLSQNGLL